MDSFTPSEKAIRLLDAAEEISRCATGTISGFYVLFVHPDKIIELRKAVQAIRPYYELEGGYKVYEREADWGGESSHPSGVV